MSTSPITLTVDPTSLEAAIANQLAASTGQVAWLNADLKSRYLSKFHDYVLNVESGQRDNSNPPVPPNAWELTPPTAAGFVFYQIGKTPVCDMPPIPNNHIYVDPATRPQNVIDIGKQLLGGGKWYSVGPVDTFPLGMTTPPQPDGHTYQKFGAPVGQGWYLQVS
jgi:hypothetical protein